jgi:hypothetical protein
MKKHAIVIAFGLMTLAACLSQQPAWRTEHHDSFIVPPNAKNVEYTTKTIQASQGPVEQEELTYTVAEPYPAPKFIDHLQKDLQEKGWTPDTQTGTNLGVWEKPPLDRSQPFECLWLMPWRSSKWESVSYWLQYKSAQDPQLKILHVHAYFGAASTPPPQSPPAPATPDASRLRQRMYGLGFLSLYLLVLAGLVRLLTLAKVRSAVFYAGDGAWLTWTNLVLMSPSFLFLLSVGGIIVAAVGPADGNVARDAALTAAVMEWAFIAFCAIAGLVASPIVLILTVSILYTQSIPKNVKIGQAVLGLLSLSFWVCTICFSGPLIRW